MALIRGELHPVAAWRKARGLTQAELGSRAGVRGATVSDIEASKSSGRFDVMQLYGHAERAAQNEGEYDRQHEVDDHPVELEPEDVDVRFRVGDGDGLDGAVFRE